MAFHRPVQGSDQSRVALWAVPPPADSPLDPWPALAKSARGQAANRGGRLAPTEEDVF